MCPTGTTSVRQWPQSGWKRSWQGRRGRKWNLRQGQQGPAIPRWQTPTSSRLRSSGEWTRRSMRIYSRGRTSGTHPSTRSSSRYATSMSGGPTTQRVCTTQATGTASPPTRTWPGCRGTTTRRWRRRTQRRRLRARQQEARSLRRGRAAKSRQWRSRNGTRNQQTWSSRRSWTARQSIRSTLCPRLQQVPQPSPFPPTEACSARTSESVWILLLTFCILGSIIFSFWIILLLLNDFWGKWKCLKSFENNMKYWMVKFLLVEVMILRFFSLSLLK